MTKYYFDPHISYKTFKKVNDEFMKIYLKKVGGDIVMKNFDRMVWQGLRDRKLNVGVDDKTEDGIFLTTKGIPKGTKIISDNLPLK